MYLENIALELIAPDKTKEILADYYLACLSRELSLLGRKEVHNGKAHFGIFGDGKEIVQLAMAKSFQKGDWRSGYYRDQTLMLALGLMKPEEFFAMIYGDTSGERNPSTGGRNFNNHFSTPNIDEKGEIKGLSYKYNSAADLSPTAGQMPRLLGLAQASKLVRNNMNFKRELSGNITGNEVSFGTIGDASTSEGMFFETINAACVMQVPMAVTIYDDGYGISVPVELQTAKGSISEALRGFAQDEKGKGCKIYHCHGWDYPSLVKMFSEGVAYCREYQIPVIFHVDELTQPTGHSTSGSHERYKSNDRLEWELKNDALKKFREFILATGETGHDTLLNIEAEAMQRAKKARDDAWNSFTGSFSQEKKTLLEILSSLPDGELRKRKMEEWKLIEDKLFPLRRSLLVLAKRTLYELKGDNRSTALTERLQEWINHFSEVGHEFYSRYLYNENRSEGIDFLEPRYGADPQWVNGSDILNINFDALFERHPTLLTFGEDTGKLGDVNQGMKGMQEKYGDHRVFDTGIREATIIGQGIGLALRGLRPIAEIQYLDYLLYALPILSDDLSSLHYRTLGRQIAPLIIRTRGHQLQGMWHAGSPMQMILGSMRGVYICVPRNMTRAAAMYNTLLETKNPALVIEPLKGYNVKEPLPENSGDYKVPLGVSEILAHGTDITLVTYGWNVHHALKAASLLAEYNISAEVIDVQTLIPFDTEHSILKSVIKTGKVLFIDEDVPGGATAFMLQKALDEQQIFNYLDTAPATLSAAEHRPAYGIDGEYFSKPHVEQIVEKVFQMMRECDTY